MDHYFDLLKRGIIDFERLIIDQYVFLGLDEIDAVLTIRLHRLLQEGCRLLPVGKIATLMSITEEECSKRIVQLATKGLISIELSKQDAKEIFILDGLYHQLSLCLNENHHQLQKGKENASIQDVISQLERGFEKMLSPFEREIVHGWFFNHQYSKESIQQALQETMKNRSRGIKYMDRLLYRIHKMEKSDATNDVDIKELFEKVYVKRK